MNNTYRIIDRITGLGINPENASFTISSGQLLKAISEELGLSHESDVPMP
jgi:hypothetical protein